MNRYIYRIPDKKATQKGYTVSGKSGPTTFDNNNNFRPKSELIEKYFTHKISSMLLKLQYIFVQITFRFLPLPRLLFVGVSYIVNM